MVVGMPMGILLPPVPPNLRLPSLPQHARQVQVVPDVRQLPVRDFPFCPLFCLAANDGHGIAIREESIALLDCCVITIKEGLSATQG